MNRPDLSIVIPFLNEEQVLPLLRARPEKIQNRPVAWELPFVSDGSTDGSTNFIEQWARIDPSVKLIVFTRNFGHQSAISAGLSFRIEKLRFRTRVYVPGSDFRAAAKIETPNGKLKYRKKSRSAANALSKAAFDDLRT
jgi:glycosyltransferase involved in cell wall biosynthesis